MLMELVNTINDNIEGALGNFMDFNARDKRSLNLGSLDLESLCQDPLPPELIETCKNYLTTTTTRRTVDGGSTVNPLNETTTERYINTFSTVKQ